MHKKNNMPKADFWRRAAIWFEKLFGEQRNPMYLCNVYQGSHFGASEKMQQKALAAVRATVKEIKEAKKSLPNNFIIK
jgi:hypothetical protein